jgi:hypothetical protein
MNFGHLAKMVNGGAAGGAASMLMEFMGSKGLNPAVTMGENSVSLNSVIIIAVVGFAIYWTKNNPKAN